MTVEIDRAFFRWLPLQCDRDDPVGKLARAYRNDGLYYETIKQFRSIMYRDEAVQALGEALSEALGQVLGEFDSARERLGMPMAPPLWGDDDDI